MTDPRQCPFCAEEIAAPAARCPYCRSRLGAFDLSAWYRDHPERKLAGVAAAASHALAVPIVIVRLAFIVFTLFLHVAPFVYAALWLLVPFAPAGEPPLERGLGEARDTLRRWRQADGSEPESPHEGRAA